MYCKDINACFEQISAYCSGKKTGYPLLVNTENLDVYQEILQRLEADNSKQCIYVSDNSQMNVLPNPTDAVTKVTGDGSFVLIGISQALMLQSSAALEKMVDELLSCSISGYTIILLDHCQQYLKKFMARDLRLQNKIILAYGTKSPLPQIKVAKNEDECIGVKPHQNMASLLSCLERLSEHQVLSNSNITVVTPFNPALFRNAVYSVTASEGIYETLIHSFADLAGATEKSYGTDEQWKWLANKMQTRKSFSTLVCAKFGSTSNLELHITEVIGAPDKNTYWLLWLSMKVFGTQGNPYLTLVLKNSAVVDDFEQHIYMDLLDMDYRENGFAQCYVNRKQLIEDFAESLPLISQYCNKAGKHERHAIYYLTDSSENEEFEFIRCLSVYEYTEDELNQAIKNNFPAISLYMRQFTFDTVNTKLSEKDAHFREVLTSYFQTYKLQKLTNRIFPEFLSQVEEFATARPYNKLRPRSSIVSLMDKKDAQMFFFDALGVEYLSFIQSKCEEYGLISEISVVRGEIPSITAKNKEFMQYFLPQNTRKIDDLDKLKHHSQVYDYRKCPEPIHLFRELEIIDVELRRIQSQLVQGAIQKAILISDHGASRLAVIYKHENQSMLELDEKGEHSGRCCPAEKDPRIPYAAYEDGYVVLANYERFKGGRKANVEVHGGASLEEVIVPVITLTRKPENIELCFVDPVVTLKIREQAQITLFSNVPLQKPRLLVNGIFYDSEFVADNRHALFVMPELKRSKEYSAGVYDGEKNLNVTLKFRIQKATGREINLL